MGSKMLIDASHPEETRVVVARGNRIEEFDFESASRKPLKGNIYLAKVTRVEPSLQAAFVEYGGNRHGFLAFAEIHPDYYQIPVADRLALLKEQEEEDAEDEDDDDHGGEPAASAEADQSGEEHQPEIDGADSDVPAPAEEDTSADVRATADGEHAGSEPVEADDEDAPSSIALAAEPGESLSSEPVESDASPEDGEVASEATPSGNGENGNGDVVTIEEDAESQKVESIGAEDALEEVPQRRPRRQPRRRQYKIQEVIKRRQILLVQVVKEERGNKGAALTTYLSLAGRYCVLMPNTARGGGISRKITDAGDRRRLKEVARDVEVPQGMGLIVRTAGAQRTRPEIKRDFDYLIRLWESVRDLTLQSQAPSLVYEEGSLIKRSIRDLYTKDVDEVVVEGDEAYREAKDFMKMLMPSHAKNVKQYRDTRPLFSRYQVENHLDGLLSPTVTLPSGGYLVINQAEALVAIDINSGKATREHSIEDTAVKTNLEAADEIARQLRLRDLAGLIVIDFIDMEENRNNRAVERRLKEALKNDRARIQVGRISHFGLLEMSRQRLRPGIIEGTFRPCPHCEGKGIVRSVPSCGLGVLRMIEDYLLKRPENLTVRCAREVAFYLLNEKRDSVLALEQAHGITIFVVPGGDELKGTQAVIEKAHDRDIAPRRLPAAAPVRMDSAYEEEPVSEETEAADEFDDADAAEQDGEASSENGDERGERGGEDRPRDGRRRRRRGRRGGRRGDREFGANGEGDLPRNQGEGSGDAEGSPGDDDDETPAQDGDGEAVETAEGSSDAETVSSEGAEGEDSGTGEREERGGRRGRRGRFGRGRGRDRDRGERGDRPERADRTERAEGDEPSARGDNAETAEAREGGERPERSERSERGERHERGDRRERRDRDGRRNREDRPRRESSGPELVAPPPSPKIEIPDHIPDPEPRKWQPPQPTVQVEAAPRKTGWWSKRTPE
jgi:ribonuclease E